MKFLFIILNLTCFLFILSTAEAQESMNPRHKELGLQHGISISSIKDSRLSARTKHLNLSHFAFVYKKWNDHKKESLIISYSGNFKNPKSENLWYKIIHPEVMYSYQRKWKGHFIGGYYHSSTLLSFPISQSGGFGNNPISYTIANSLGIVFNKTQSLLSHGKHSVDLDASAQVALLSYLIRPAYGHPYPEDFLKEDTFNPTQAGLGKSIVKSGKIRSLNKYQSFRLVLGINYYFKDSFKVNATFAFDFQNNSALQKSSILSKDILLGLSYIY